MVPFLGGFDLVFKRVLLKALALVIALAAGFISAGSIYNYKDTISDDPAQPLPHVDAVVCLAGGRGRIQDAADLWYRYWKSAQADSASLGNPPFLYVSGMGPKANFSTFESQVRPEVMAVLKSEWVVLENESINTLENAKWLKYNAYQYKWNSIALVTSNYHMRRALLIFDRTLANKDFRVESYTARQDLRGPETYWMSNQKIVWVTLAEYFKYLFYQLVL